MVISEDRFISLLSSTVCSKAFDSITYTFKDVPSYQEVQKSWQWVNQMAFRSFILTLTDQGCQATQDGDGRQAYQVNGIKWSDSDRQAVLQVVAKTFMDATSAGDTTGASGNTWDMTVDTTGLTAAQQRKRLVDKSFSINVAQDFSQNIFKSSVVSVDCAQCNTKGSLNFKFQFSPRILRPSTGSAELRTIGVGATALISVTASKAADPIIKNFPIKTVALPGGFTIRGIATFGPTLNIGVGAQLNTINATGQVTFGVNLNLPDSTARADLFNSKNNQFTGFRPTFSSIPPTLKAQANLKGTIGPQLILAIEATIFNKGLSAGLALIAPALITNIQATGNSQGGVCSNANVKAGVSFGVDVGATFDAFAGMGPASGTPNRNNIFSTSTNVYSTCIGIGARAAATPTPV